MGSGLGLALPAIVVHRTEEVEPRALGRVSEDLVRVRVRVRARVSVRVKVRVKVVRLG